MILQLFNWVHILVLLTIPAFIVGAWWFFKDKSPKAKQILMWVILGTTIVAYTTNFTIACITNEQHRATILKQLPLHMCRINVFLYPVCFLLLKNKNEIVRRCAMGYAFFVGSPGALLASLMPPGSAASPDILGSPIYQFNVIIFFVMHNLIFLFPIMLVALKYYKPRAMDMVYSFVTLLALVCVMHVVNLILSAIGGYTVNYFYTRVANNILLEVFWNIVPVELLYMFGLFIVLAPIFAIYYFSSRIPDYIKKIKQQEKTHNS